MTSPPTEAAVTALVSAMQEPALPAAEMPEPEMHEPTQETELLQVDAVALAAPARVAEPAPAAAEQPKRSDTFGAVFEAQKIAVQGCEQIFETLGGLVTTSLSASREAGIALLDAKTLFDAIAINLEFSNRAATALLDSSCRLSAITRKTAADASRSLTEPA